MAEAAYTIAGAKDFRLFLNKVIALAKVLQAIPPLTISVRGGFFLNVRSTFEKRLTSYPRKEAFL